MDTNECLLWQVYRRQRLLERPETQALLKRGGPRTREEAAIWAVLEEGRAARGQLVLDNMGLVYTLAHRYKGVARRAGLELEDLIHYGVTGLLEALDRFDPSKGFRLSTWAYHRVRWRIQEAIGKGHRGEMSLEEELPETDGVCVGDLLSAEGPSPAETAEGRLLAQAAEEAAPGLLTLMSQGLSFRQAAERLGETPKALQGRLARSLPGWN